MYSSELIITEKKASRRSQQMTAKQMAAHYDQADGTSLSLKDQVLAASGKALISLGQRLQPGSVAQPGTAALENK